MGTLNLTLPDGRSGTVQVGDDFASLPADKQAATIDDIKSALAPHNSFSADLQGGLHDLGTSVSQGLNVAGGIMSRNGMPDWGGDVSGAGGWVQSHTPDAPAGPAPSEQLAGALKNGDWSDVPSLALHSAVRAAPSAAPVLAAGALGGPVAAGAVAGATAIGPEAYARAANNGRSQPTTSDVVEALPGAAGEALGGALVPGSSKFTGPIARGAYRLGSEAAGGAIMDTAGQLGASVGTDKGAQYDPYQTAASALSQGVIGAGRSVPDTAASGAKAVSDRAMAGTLEAPQTRDDAESVIRVGQLMDGVRDNAVNNNGKAPPDTAIANSVKSDLVTKLNRQVRQLRDAGLVGSSDASDLNQLINNQALRNNNTISEGLPGVASLYDRVDDLGLPDVVIQQIKNDVRDLNTVSSQSFIKNTTGPLQQAGQFLGRWGGTAAELSQGNLPGAAMTAMLGHPAGKIGGAIGAVGDRALGLNTPPIVLQRMNAQRVLRQMGVDPSGVQPTGDAMSLNSRTAQAGQPDPATGLPPSPIPVNTPVPASTPTPPASSSVSTLPPLRVDTAATVRSALDEADRQLGANTPATPPAGPPQQLVPNAPATTTPVVSKFLPRQGSTDLINTVPATTPETVHQAAADWVRSRGAATGAEHGVIVDNRTGTIIHASTDGSRDGVPLRFPKTPEYPEGSLVYHHNHPSEQSLSGPDLQMLVQVPELSHVVAHTPTGGVYVASRTPTTAQALAPERIQAIVAAKRATGWTGNRDTPDTNRQFVDLTNRLLAAKGVINYASTGTLSPATLDAIPEMSKYWGRDPEADKRQLSAVSPQAALAGLTTKSSAPATPPAGAAQRLATAQATLQAPQPSAAPMAPTGAFTPGSKYLANTRPGATHADAVSMARAAEAAGAVPKGTADLIDRSPAPLDRQLLENIKAHAAGAIPSQGPDQPVIHSPIRYQASIDKYHMHVMNDVASLRRSGQHDAANAMLNIAVNMHTKANKQAARAALPPAVAKQIPDYVVNQGG